jgi:hypothetical protein
MVFSNSLRVYVYKITVSVVTYHEILIRKPGKRDYVEIIDMALVNIVMSLRVAWKEVKS